jgi:hypothetical protein
MQAVEPLAKPRALVRPNISQYQASNTAITAYTNAYNIEHLGAVTVPPFVPERLSDLSNNAKTSYKEDVEDYKGQLDSYKIEHAEYQLETTSIAKVTNFIRTTVSSHLAANCCRPNKPYRD